MKAMIGVDIGTTSTKAVAYDLQGNVQAYANISYPLYQDTPDTAEEDPEEIFSAVVEVLTQVTRKAALNPGDLQGVSFSAAMHSLILLDKDKQPLSRAITWADNRSANMPNN